MKNSAERQWLMKTELCPLYLVASDTGLRGIHWDKQRVPMLLSLSETCLPAKILGQTVIQLEEYFRGVRKNFDIPLETHGTAFQKQVWRELAKIPYGQTRSYKDIARAIRNPNAVRAVGTANGRNPFSIIVPCHRVIAADGTLGGYGGGLKIKTKLLALENRVRSKHNVSVGAQLPSRRQ